MADAKLTALTENTAPTSDDFVYLVNDPGGTPASKKATLANVRKALVAGSDTEVQFNDAGSLGGDAGLTYNKTTNVLSVNGSANTLESAGSSTGEPVTFTASGSDAYIPIRLVPEGYGVDYQNFAGVLIGPNATVSADLFVRTGAASLLIEDDTTNAGNILLHAAGDDTGYYNSIHMFASRGTLLVPTKSLDADVIGVNTWQSYGVDRYWNTFEIEPFVDGVNDASGAYGGVRIRVAQGATPLGSTAGITMRSSGNIGIGTLTPLVPFHIVGQTRIDNLTASKPTGTDASKNLISLTTTGSGDSVLATSPTIITPTIAKLANLTSNGFVKTSGGDGTLSVDTSTYLTTAVTSAIGTANQVNVSGATGAVTFSTPQDIATSSTPQFARIGIGGAADAGILGLITGGSVAASTPALKITATYNNVANTYQTVVIDTTDTTSAAASTILDVRQAGTSVFKVQKTTGTFAANVFATAFRATSSGLSFDDSKVYLGTAFQVVGGSSQFAADVGLRRNTTGVFEIDNGTSGQWGALLTGVRDAGTTIVTNGLTIGHQSTGTPAAGLGSALLFNINSSTTADQNAAQISALWTDATHASRSADIVFKAVNNAGALAEVGRLTGLGVFNAIKYKVNGTAGANFGPGLPTSVTVVDGIITAIS